MIGRLGRRTKRRLDHRRRNADCLNDERAEGDVMLPNTDDDDGDDDDDFGCWLRLVNRSSQTSSGLLDVRSAENRKRGNRLRKD